MFSVRYEINFFYMHTLYSIHCAFSGPGTVVGIATGYGLDGPGIECRWGRDFPRLSIPALVITQPLVPGLSQG